MREKSILDWWKNNNWKSGEKWFANDILSILNETKSGETKNIACCTDFRRSKIDWLMKQCEFMHFIAFNDTIFPAGSYSFFFIAHWIDDSKCFNDAFGHCCYSYTIQFRGMKWGKMLFDYVKFQYFAEIKLLKLFCLCWNEKMSHIKMNLWLKIQLKPRRFMRQKRIVDDGGRISRALIEWLFGAFHVYQYLRLILRNWMLLMRMYENKR